MGMSRFDQRHWRSGSECGKESKQRPAAKRMARWLTRCMNWCAPSATCRGKNVYFSAKMEKQKDEQTGSMLYSPSMPGQKLGQALPYFFDEVLVLRAEKDADGNLAASSRQQAITTLQRKTASGALDLYEPNGLVRHSRQDRWHTQQ